MCSLIENKNLICCEMCLSYFILLKRKKLIKRININREIKIWIHGGSPCIHI